MNAIVLETVRWSSLTDIDSVPPLNDDGAVLGEIREVLLRYGKQARFGVRLLHRHFNPNEDEVAVEYTDPGERISKVIVENREYGGANAVQTVWRLLDGAPTMGTICVSRCGKSGMTHSTVHQKQRT